MSDFKKPYPTKVWGLETIFEYVDLYNMPIQKENYTEDNKETLCLDIKEYISKVSQEEKNGNNEGSETGKESETVETVEEIVEVMPLYTQKYTIGGTDYYLKANRPIKVPKNVARMLNQARVLKYII